MVKADPQGGFLTRWSRLKAGVEPDCAEAQARTTGTPPPAGGSIEGRRASGSAHCQEGPVTGPSGRGVDTIPDGALSDADMPELGTLGEGSDYGMFLGEGVSATLRRKALRQLFHSDAYQLRDGLNEYDDDYTGFSPLGDTVTRQMKAWAERAISQQEQAARVPAPGDSQVASGPAGGAAEPGSGDPVAPAAEKGDPETADPQTDNP